MSILRLTQEGLFMFRRRRSNRPPIRLLRGRVAGSIVLFVLALGALGILTPAGVHAQQLLPPPPDVFKSVDIAVPTPGTSPTAVVVPRKPQHAGPLTGRDLGQVEEVELDQLTPHNAVGHAVGQQATALISRIKDSNAKKVDAFIEELMSQRPELRGMPFAMGDACRLKEERRAEFGVAAALVRNSLRKAGETNRNSATPSERTRVQEFWKLYDEAAPRKDLDRRKHVAGARVAALEQVLGPETPAMHAALVQHLQQIADPESTRALTRLAVFSAADEVRKAALKALQERPAREVTEVLMHGLRHPWPVAAERAAEAIAQLGRKDLVPELVNLLGERDPRLPVIETIEGKKTPVVREMVRVNHTRNCLMCHSPATGGDQILGLGLTTAQIPTSPSDTPSDGYRSDPGFPDILVRIDVTYLRQDFSVMQPVQNSQPWPQLQRFDFLVRKRQLTKDEAEAYTAKLGNRGEPSPYQLAANTALRQLTGKAAEPTAEAWRQLLNLQR